MKSTAQRDDDEFGLSSSDETDLIAVADNAILTSREDDSAARDQDDDYGLDFSDEAEMINILQKLEETLRYMQNIFISTNMSHANIQIKKFQLKQEQAISRILSGGSAVVVFPTGGGKSLCYQIPALAFAIEDSIANVRGPEESGITLVISPLIALMKDQVDTLVKKGIPARQMTSAQTREEFFETFGMIHSGTLKLLYCAPERLNNEGVLAQMKHVRGGIRLVAVDEAHCISEWGHAFRPDYLKISRFVDEIKAERVICLTATVTPRVADDILKAFKVDKSCLFRTPTYRRNLRLLAESASTKHVLVPKLIAFLSENQGSSIVYVTIQKQTEALALILRNAGLKAKAFHAGIDVAQKTEIQDLFMGSDDLIIVATIAFGMGIDKATIRTVVHFNIPNSLESYSQEIGRAGRDGRTSNCMFYVCAEDLHLREMFARAELPSKESIRGLLNEIFDSNTKHLPIGSELKFFHGAQEKDFDICSTMLKSIYAQLEITHGLLRATSRIYTKYMYTTGPLYTRSTADKSRAACAILLTSKLKKTWTQIEVDVAAFRHKIPRLDIISKLHVWNEEGLIELKTSGILQV